MDDQDQDSENDDGGKVKREMWMMSVVMIAICYAENAICCIDNVMTTVKGFQGRSRSIANII